MVDLKIKSQPAQCNLCNFHKADKPQRHQAVQIYFTSRDTILPKQSPSLANHTITFHTPLADMQSVVSTKSMLRFSHKPAISMKAVSSAESMIGLSHTHQPNRYNRSNRYNRMIGLSHTHQPNRYNRSNRSNRKSTTLPHTPAKSVQSIKSVQSVISLSHTHQPNRYNRSNRSNR